LLLLLPPPLPLRSRQDHAALMCDPFNTKLRRLRGAKRNEMKRNESEVT
jgi:hypothetical protein